MQTQIYYENGRRHSRRTHYARTESRREIPATNKKDSNPKLVGRPYLLKRFYQRRDNKTRSISLSEFKQIRKEVINYALKEHKININLPRKLSPEFFDTIREELCQDFLCRIEICENNGKHLYIEEPNDSEEQTEILDVGGIWDIPNSKVSDCLKDILSYITKNSAIKLYPDTIWYHLIEDFRNNTEYVEDEESNILEMLAEFDSSETETKSKEISERKQMTKQELLLKMESVLVNVTMKENEKDLLEFLKNNIDLYSRDLFEDNSMNMMYSSVLIEHYDYFPIVMNMLQDPILLGIEYGYIMYQGDVWWEPIMIGKVITENGWIETDSKTDFLNFINEFSRKLKKLKNANNT